jgi:hypothetical protein
VVCGGLVGVGIGPVRGIACRDGLAYGVTGPGRDRQGTRRDARVRRRARLAGSSCWSAEIKLIVGLPSVVFQVWVITAACFGSTLVTGSGPAGVLADSSHRRNTGH